MTDLHFIINGERVAIQVSPTDSIRAAVEQALVQSNNISRPVDEWELRHITGELVADHTQPAASLREGELYLTLRVGGGGNSKPAVEAKPCTCRSGVDGYRGCLLHDATPRIETTANEAPATATVNASPWPLHVIVWRLANAVDHLLHDHDCDAHGHEGVLYAMRAARDWLDASGYDLPYDRAGADCHAPSAPGPIGDTDYERLRAEALRDPTVRRAWAEHRAKRAETMLANEAMATSRAKARVAELESAARVLVDAVTTAGKWCRNCEAALDREGHKTWCAVGDAVAQAAPKALAPSPSVSTDEGSETP